MKRLACPESFRMPALNALSSVSLWAYLSHVDCGGCIAALHSARVGVGGRGAGKPRTARHAAHSHRERRP